MKNSDLANKYVAKSIESYVKTAIVFLIIYACFLIFKPFLLPVVWGAIIAIALYPLHLKLTKVFTKSSISSLLLTLILLSLLIIPSVSIIGSLVDDVKVFVANYNEGNFSIQPPPQEVAEWPVVGKSIYGIWNLFSSNLQTAIEQYTNEIKGILEWIAGILKSISGSLLIFIVSVVLAGVFLNIPSVKFKGLNNIVVRLAGSKGNEIVDNSVKTIRSVVTGVLGTAVIQTAIIALALFVFKVPGAPILTIVCLFMAIAQLPVILLILPVIIYMFSVLSGGSAVLLSIWLIVGGLSDNILKPMLLGRGLKIPMLVILIGAIGGMLLLGIIGLFIGAVIMALGYQLFQIWIESPVNHETETEKALET